MRRLRPIIAVACALAAGTQARADLIKWTYSWDRAPIAVDAGTGGVGLTSEPTTLAQGNSDVVATNLRIFSSASPSTPDVFGPSDGNYALTMTLKDFTSGQSAALTFKGQLGGSFSFNNANVTNSFKGALTQSVVLGGNLYTVTLSSFSPPGPPAQSNAGSIGAHVKVSANVAGGKPPGSPNPEPSTLVLSGLGLSCFGGAAWRLRRFKAAA